MTTPNIDPYFTRRATVRSYSDRHFPDSLLDEMLYAASHAPNTGNMQWYSVVVTRSDEGKRRLAPTHFGQPQVAGAQAVLTFCLDLRRFEHWCRLRRAEPGFDNFQSFTAALIDTCLVAQQFCTVAEKAGLGTCYLGTTTYNAPQIAEALGLPDRVVPVTTVTVGYPAAEAAPSWRLPAEAWVHSERYADPSDADIERWYASLEADPQSDVFIRENGKETLAQVFTDVRYPRDSAENFSRIYIDFLKRNQF